MEGYTFVCVCLSADSEWIERAFVSFSNNIKVQFLRQKYLRKLKIYANVNK